MTVIFQILFKKWFFTCVVVSLSEESSVNWIKQWGKLKILEKNLSILEWTRAILEHAEPASVESKQTGKGSIWAMRHIPNRRKYEFEREKLT